MLRGGHTTVIRLPFRSKQAREAIDTRLAGLEPHFLLLCRNLDTVTIGRPESPSMHLTVSRQRSADLRNSPATLTRQTGTHTERSEWRIWSSLAPAPDERSKSLSAAIAIRVVDGVPTPHSEEIPLHVFFPTLETIAARFLVHGSFALTSNRNSIRQDKYDEDVRKALADLVRPVIEDMPASSVVRLFGEMVRAARGGRAKRADRLIQQAIAGTVTSSEFVRLIGGGRARPGDVRTWEHNLDGIVPPVVAGTIKLPTRELSAEFGELRSIFGAEPLRARDYASILAQTRCTDPEEAVKALAVAYSGCLAADIQHDLIGLLARAPIWPTDLGHYRALDGHPRLLKVRPSRWPDWLPAEALHPTAQELLNGYDTPAKARWEVLLQGRLLRTREDWLRHALAPALELWSGEQWEETGYDALTILDEWHAVPDFTGSTPFVENPGDMTLRPVLAKAARVPTRRGWIPAHKAYAGREVSGSPELANYFRSVADRAVVGAPAKALARFGMKRWKALLRYLGVSWEPKIQLVPHDGTLTHQAGYSRFTGALDDRGLIHVDQEWYIEHFPESLAGLGAAQVASCVVSLVRATAGLSARWRKISWASRTHSPFPFSSYADFQLRRERYLPQRPTAGERSGRLAPHELFWFGKGIAGITPILDVGTIDKVRRSSLRSTFVDGLKVRDALPRDWATWSIWSDQLLARIEAGTPSPPRAIRDFYDALLRLPHPPEGAQRIERVAALRPGSQEEVSVQRSADVIWIDHGRFDNQEVLAGLGQIGRTILPVRLDRGEGATRILGVRRASKALTVTPQFQAASARHTLRLESRLRGRRGALAAICRTKNLPLKVLPKLMAVYDLRLSISLDGVRLADRSAASFNDEGRWLISLQAACVEEAVASAVAEPFGAHAADLKYRFARVLRARRDEIASILAEDGIPGYRIREALHDAEEDDEEERDPADEQNADVADDGAFDKSWEDKDADDGEGIDGMGAGDRPGHDGRSRVDGGDDGASRNRDQNVRGERDRTRRLTRRTLFSGRGEDEGPGSRRRDAAEAAKAAAGRGLRAEAWLMGQVAASLGPDWRCSGNVRDEALRETDLLLSRSGADWHIEVKSLSAERIYWSELERQKAEQHRGNYFMALLVESDDGTYRVRWSWEPLRDLAGLERRIEWVWSSASEGPSLRDRWRLEPGLRWPERCADRYLHVVRVTEDDLAAFDEDGDGLVLLRRKIGDVI